MSMLDEELVVSDDTDFEDLFPTPSENQADDEIDTAIIDEEYEVEEAPKKKRGRPAKAAAEKKPATKKKKDDEEAPAPRKRGRPAKKVVAVVEEEEEEPAPVVKKGRKKAEPVVEEDVFDEEIVEQNAEAEKKPRAKRVSVDDLNPDVLDRIYEEYSIKPAAELAEELDLTEKKVHKAIDRMRDLFEMSISTGDLSEEDFNEFISPKLQAYQEPKDCFDAYVRNTVKKIKKNKK